MSMNVDTAFGAHFKNRLRQVFLYLTDECDAACDYCLYKTTLGALNIPFRTLTDLLSLLRSYGASKVTLIGGEPTLYFDPSTDKRVGDVVRLARALGFEYTRVDTNGRFDPELLEDEGFALVNNLAFSLDAADARSNDCHRGPGSHSRCVANIRSAIDAGYSVSITSCVSTDNIEHLPDLFDFARRLGVPEVNLHPLFLMGVARDSFTGDSHLEPRRWLEEYARLRESVDNNCFGIRVRVPRRYVSVDDYRKNEDRYQYCPVRLGERVLVHPDGTLRICALAIGSPLHIGRYDEGSIHSAIQNSELNVRNRVSLPCAMQVRAYDGLVPLCISYKPKQEEFVWKAESFDDRYA